MPTELAAEAVARAAPAGRRGAVDRDLADALARGRHRLSVGLLANLSGWSKFADEIEAGREGDEFLRRAIYAFVDYLSLYHRGGDDAYLSLYVGEKLKLIYHDSAGEDPAERRARVERLLDDDEATLLGGLSGVVPAASADALRATLAEVRRVVLSDAPTTAEILLVGDCLHVDVQAFLRSQCLEDGISLSPTFASSKNGPGLRAELRALAGRRFDLVAYSPFTYEFSPAIAGLASPRRALAGAASMAPAIDSAMADVEATLRLLASQFDAPIVVHKTANVRRHDGGVGDRLRNLVTRRSRRLAREALNRRLDSAAASINELTYEHVFFLDERDLLADRSEDELGRKFYDSDLQHPAVLGRALADVYRDLVAARARLLGRKLVVCDLDNTLWAGEIGEGAVTQLPDRQRVLRRLKGKGVVLAINSKNDRSNVRWDGALLGADDFVHAEINWDSKVSNMRRIREALNLKYKDYVFIDDRADQLAQVGSALPEILGLDATLARSWRLLAAWESILPRQTEGDRTQLYREREAREGFVAGRVEEDPSALFAELGIRVTLREAARGDLHRVAELINRTNQFNLAGTRTSFGEVSRWHDDPGTRVVVADAADKFGQMGTVCVAVLRREGGGVRIPAFVLSCRVFGYGIETAVLNLARRLSGGGPVVGDYRETPHNGPCRSTYPDHGFARDGAGWSSAGPSTTPDPAWLAVDDRVSAGAGVAAPGH